MTERNEQGFVRDINQAIEEIKQYNQSSKEKVRALINLPFDFNDVPSINNYINEETTQAVECIDELNNIAILNEQILEFDETLKSKFEERHNELVEALMNRLEGVFKMYNNENLNQNVQPTYPAVGQPVDVQTPQVEEFNPVTPVESYAAPAVEAVPQTYGVAPETFAEPTVQEPVAEVPAMEIPAVELPTMEAPAVPEQVAEVPEVEAPVVSEPVAEIPAMDMPVVELPAVGAPVAEFTAVDAPVEELPQAEEGFVGPELTDELFSDEAKALAGIIVPTVEELPESADLNDKVEAPEVPAEEEKEEVEEKPVAEDEEDEEIRRIREHHREMEEVEVRMWKNKKTLEEKRLEIADLEQGLAADEEELERLRRM